MSGPPTSARSMSQRSFSAPLPSPLVSVIVPVYNVERYLDCCLDSIRGQTYNRLEIIVVEDCSTDASLSRLQPHLVDPRVRLIRHECNSGLSAARNTGIEAATGEYMMFVDSDDAIAQTLVQSCVAHVGSTRSDVVVFDFVAFRDGEPLPEVGEAVDSSEARRLQGVEYFNQPHFAWLKFIRADLLRNPSLRFPVGLYYEDWPFHWELGFAVHPIYMLGGKWYCYRQRATSITASFGRKLLDQFKVQEIVLDAVRERLDKAEVQALSTKVHASFWAVLTHIDTELLPEAIADAKRLRAGLQSVVSVPPSGVRNALMASVLSLPSPIAVFAIHLIRWLKRGARVLACGNFSEKNPT